MTSVNGARPRTYFLQFDVGRWRYAGMAFGIALLNMMTFGLYKAYGLTRMRRALYNNIYVGKDALSYSGDAGALSRVTFYPSLALLFLLLVPGILQFYVGWKGVVALTVLQALLLIPYNEYLKFLSRRFELGNTSWRGMSVELAGSPLHYAGMALLTQLGCLLTFGLLAPWRRVWLARVMYGQMSLGRLPVGSDFSVKPLLLSYLPGWLLSLGGFVYGCWYFWQNAGVALMGMIGGTTPDPAAAATPAGGMDLLSASGMPAGMGSGMGLGMGGGDDLGGLGPVLNALNLAFIVYPLWQMWKILCLAPYEAVWWRHFFAALTVGGATPRFEGNWFGLCWRALIAFVCNFMTANLSRPFTTYSRIRYFVTHTVIAQADALENALRPPTKTLPDSSI